MNKEQLQECATAMIAYIGGASVEYKHPSSSEWTHTPTPIWDIRGGFIYRVMPKPKTRQWSKPEDVPVPVCWIRDHNQHRLVTAIDQSGLMVGSYLSGETKFSWDAFKNRKIEYSTDRLTWKPCEVME